MVDNKTAHLALPLPDLSNMQDEDVPRIGGALNMLDAHAKKVDSALESQGREVAELKAGNQAQAGSFELLARALETEKAERSEADEAASIKLQELATGQNDIGQRVDTLGETSADHGTRLDAAEQGITAISTTLIGSIMSITAAEGYVPNGTVPADAAEYTREQFREFYDTYLVGGKLLTCTYAAFAAQVALTGNCAKFALDADAQKFKVPLLKDGDSITQAASASEMGKSYKAGLPNVTGTLGYIYGSDSGPQYSVHSGIVAQVSEATRFAGGGGEASVVAIDLSRGNSIYGNSTTVTDEQIRLRHFVVLASAQNSASVFDWSNYMAGLAGKANLDMDNMTRTGTAKVANCGKPSARAISVAVPAYGSNTPAAPASGAFKFGGVASAAGQYIRLSRESYTTDDIQWASAGGQTLICTVAVRKGDAVWINGNVPNNLAMTFIYDEGAD
ncbi:hypothetical protein JMF94_13065 [Desulfovibrio sp. UIB00]|uniref:hypothetical protein n=1 Tax=Desulfovibrio sp. UIB00 TaxID=2804314 RepID=UPI001F0D9E32|nr:hypothetical protein [Desulfovibrio sp. UIB00]MCH5146014.1 hypothetical protein [Desulfovibrio sp. UIB00]